MATVNNVKIVVQADNKASAPIEEATESVKKLGEQTKKVTRQSKKDWTGLGDLFSQVLPRNLQQLSRGFKSTQRQVGRLSKGFKALKAAWAAIGIGLIIIALELLVENWDKVTDAINGTTQAEKDLAKVQKAGVDATINATSKLDVYRNVLNDTTASEVSRKDALVKLAQATGLLEGIDINNPEDQLKINKAYEDYLDNLGKQAQFDKATLEITEKKKALEDGSAKDLGVRQTIALSLLAISGSEVFVKEKLKAQLENQKKVQDELTALQLQQATLQNEAAKSQNEITQAIKKQKDEAEKLAKTESDARKVADQAEREAETARKKRIADREADEKFLANQRIKLARDTELKLIVDEEKKALRSLELQNEDAKAELKLRGATLSDLLQLEQNYILDRENIENDFQSRRDEKQDEIDAKALSDQELVTEALATDQANEIIRETEKYDALLLLAQKDSQDFIDLTKLKGEQIEIINKKFEQKEREESLKTQSLKIQGVTKMANVMRGILGSVGDMAEEGSKKQRNLAIVDVLLSQAIAIGNAIAGATAAAAASTVAAPVVTPILIAQMVGQVMAAFAGIKGIMNKAGASMPSGGGGGSSGGGGARGATTQVPLPSRLDSDNSNQAFVVQSQLQGQQLAQKNLNGQIVL